MLEHIKDGKPWHGEAIDNVRHPLNIENLWSEGELAKIGLRVRPTKVKPPPTLEQAKDRTRDRLESKAEQKRLEYITPGVGQAMTYLEKRDQAEEVIAQGEDVANAMSYEEAREAFPTLAATIGVDAPTLWEVAQLVMQKAHIWANKSFEIEILRANAKKKINEAGTVEEVKAAYDAIDWDAI